MWRHLRHPNILPLLGVDLEPHRLSMISEWMDQGNINEYVKEQEGVNRLQLVSYEPTSYKHGDQRGRLIQLFEVATGLEYMHSLNMVHGDLKGVQFFLAYQKHECSL